MVTATTLLIISIKQINTFRHPLRGNTRRLMGAALHLIVVELGRLQAALVSLEVLDNCLLAQAAIFFVAADGVDVAVVVVLDFAGSMITFTWLLFF